MRKDMDKDALTQDRHVDPRTGLIRINKVYRSWQHQRIEHARERQTEFEARRRIVDERTQLHRLAGYWFRVDIAPLPEEYWGEVVYKGRTVRKRMAQPRFDVLLKRVTSRLHFADRIERKELYASDQVYAVSKRQLSDQELKAHRLL